VTIELELTANQVGDAIAVATIISRLADIDLNERLEEDPNRDGRAIALSILRFLENRLPSPAYIAGMVESRSRVGQ